MKIGIVGLGLIGGSIGRAAVKRTDHEVFATDISGEAMLKGALLNAYNTELTSDNAKDIDILFVCVYPSGVAEIIDKYAPLLKPGAVIIDCVGIKREVVKIMEDRQKIYKDIAFIGGHPMAGREFSGIEHSVNNLFDHATCLLVPVHTPIEATAKVKKFFLEIGFDGVVITTAEEHDKMIAYTSQLAHVVSNAYVMSPAAQNHHGFSAGSFRDMTRVARLNPTMWTDLMMNNSDLLGKEVDTLIKRLEQFRDALQNKDSDKLYNLLSEGNEAKLEVEKNRNQKRNNAIDK